MRSEHPVVETCNSLGSLFLVILITNTFLESYMLCYYEIPSFFYLKCSFSNRPIHIKTVIKKEKKNHFEENSTKFVKNSRGRLYFLDSKKFFRIPSQDSY